MCSICSTTLTNKNIQIPLKTCFYRNRITHTRSTPISIVFKLMVPIYLIDNNFLKLQWKTSWKSTSVQYNVNVISWKMTSKGDVEVRAIIKFCVGIEQTPTETCKMIQASSTTKKCCRSLVLRWHDMFRNGRESIEDDKRCGRPSVVKTGVKDKVRELIKEDRRRTVRKMSSELGVSLSTVHDCLKEDNMSKVIARWVPRLLKNDERERRLHCSREFVRRVEWEGLTFLDRIITTDETWLFHYDPETKQESSVWKTP